MQRGNSPRQVARHKIEEQPITGPTLDSVALPLPSDRSEANFLQNPRGSLVAGNRPSMDRPQVQLAEADPDDLGRSSARQSPASKAWLAQGIPELRSSERRMDAAEAYHANRRVFVPPAKREREESLGALRDRVFQGQSSEGTSCAEIEPHGNPWLGEPAGDHLQVAVGCRPNANGHVSLPVDRRGLPRAPIGSRAAGPSPLDLRGQPLHQCRGRHASPTTSDGRRYREVAASARPSLSNRWHRPGSMATAITAPDLMKTCPGCLIVIGSPDCSEP
jgi:hypothetical protein